MHVPWWVGWSLALLVLFCLLRIGAARMAYYPLKYPAGEWQLQPDLGAEDVWLRATDGVKLHAWWTPAPDARAVTLFLHGNAGNITHRFEHIREITGAGSSILVVDYRGYGKSEGSPSESGLYRDADAAYEYVRGRGNHIVIHGESLGTAVAIDLASRVECAAVVLEAPFTSGSDIAGSVLPLVGPLLFGGFDSMNKIAKIRKPILVFQGDRDEVIAPRLGRKLFGAANEPKWFVSIPEAHHNDVLEIAGPVYPERLRELYAYLARQ